MIESNETVHATVRTYFKLGDELNKNYILEDYECINFSLDFR